MKIEESKYHGFTIFNVIYDASDSNLLSKITQFAKQSSGSTYRRSGMDNTNHVKNIEIGKRAEAACAYLLKSLYNEYNSKSTDPNELELGYANEIDQYDFIFRKKRIDVKSSSMTTKARQYTLEEAIVKFNFTVLLDQSRKDIIIQSLYPSRSSYNNFWFFVWQYVNTVINKGTDKYIKMNGNSGHYKLFPLEKGIKLEELIKGDNI